MPRESGRGSRQRERIIGEALPGSKEADGIRPKSTILSVTVIYNYCKHPGIVKANCANWKGTKKTKPIVRIAGPCRWGKNSKEAGSRGGLCEEAKDKLAKGVPSSSKLSRELFGGENPLFARERSRLRE